MNKTKEIELKEYIGYDTYHQIDLNELEETKIVQENEQEEIITDDKQKE